MPENAQASPESDATPIEFTIEQTDRLGHWLSECLDDAAPLNERVWRSRAEWMVKGPTFQTVLREIVAARVAPLVQAVADYAEGLRDAEFHEVWPAYEDNEAECTDECPGCAALELLAAAERVITPADLKEASDG